MGTKYLRLVAITAAAGIASACSNGSDGSGGSGTNGTNGTTGTGGGTATLTISLMDAPVDDVTQVNVEIAAIWLKSADEDAPPFELPLEDAPLTVDLLALTDENAAILVDEALIEPGEYEWLAMDVNAEIDNLLDSYVVTDTGTSEEIFVPSGRVRLVDGFDVASNQAVQLLFDWDMRKGLVHPPGLGGYILKPAFRVIDATVFGALSGEISVDTVMAPANDCNLDSEEADYDVGNVVYVFADHGVTPDDVDEADPEPVATAEAVLNEASTHYAYRTLLPFGDYTVAFTCQAANDFPETNELGNDDAEDDSVAFFEPAVDVTLSDAPDEIDVVVDF